MHDADHGGGIFQLVTHDDMRRFVNGLPGLRQVDLLLWFAPKFLEPRHGAMINLADVFTHVQNMTVYIGEEREDLKEKIERMNANRKHRFQVKTVKWSVGNQFLIW